LSPCQTNREGQGIAVHSILEDIVAATRQRVAATKQELSLAALVEKVDACARASTNADAAVDAPPLGDVGAHARTGPSSDGIRASRPFEAALATPGLSFICELKKASPSKGLIAQSFDHRAIAREYEAAGAAALSVLTEPRFFQGSPRYLVEVAEEVSIPTLRKDFIIDEYQIYEARLLNADALLLIVALLDDKQLAGFIARADELGLDALVEAHTADEVKRALVAGGRIIGVNNRDLNSFEVRLSTSLALREKVPRDLLFVAESGIRGAEDVRELASVGVDAVLIGESMMRSHDRAAFLECMREAAR
jgi:indole-3-glycerol phosphate synthase